MKLSSLLTSRQTVVIVVIGVTLIVVMGFNSRLADLSHIEGQRATVVFQATGIMVTQSVLETQQAVATSPETVIGYAQGEAHMAKPGDHVVVVLPVPGATPPPTPIPTPVVNDLTPWDVWMTYIFGK